MCGSEGMFEETLSLIPHFTFSTPEVQEASQHLDHAHAEGLAALGGVRRRGHCYAGGRTGCLP